MAAPFPPFPQEIIRYELNSASGYVKTNQVLGQGGFGTVWLYKNTNDPLDFAAGKHLNNLGNNVRTSFSSKFRSPYN